MEPWIAEDNENCTIVLCYGIKLKRSKAFPWRYEGEFEEWLYENVLNGRSKRANESFFSYFSHRSEERSKYDISLVENADYDVYILIIRKTKRIMEFGDVMPIDDKEMKIMSEWNDKLNEFCRKHALEKESNPCWMIISYE